MPRSETRRENTLPLGEPGSDTLRESRRGMELLPPPPPTSSSVEFCSSCLEKRDAPAMEPVWERFRRPPRRGNISCSAAAVAPVACGGGEAAAGLGAAQAEESPLPLTAGGRPGLDEGRAAEGRRGRSCMCTGSTAMAAAARSGSGRAAAAAITVSGAGRGRASTAACREQRGMAEVNQLLQTYVQHNLKHQRACQRIVNCAYGTYLAPLFLILPNVTLSCPM